MLRQAVADGRKLVERIIREHPEVHADGGDLIDMLGRAGEHEPGLLENPEWQYQIIALLIAGHETTAVALTWTWYLLAQHPSIAERLYTEVDTVLDGRLPRKDDLAALPWCDRGVQGGAASLSARCPIIPRMAYEEFSLGDYPVAPGSVVLICPWVTHRDERFFLPPRNGSSRERWLEGPEPRRYTYLPFSGGPRTCIGASFAHPPRRFWPSPASHRQYRLELTAGEEPRPALPGVGLRPHNGMPMQVAARARPVQAAHRDSEQRATGPA